MLRKTRGTRGNKMDNWKSWNAIIAEGRRVSKQIDKDSQRIMAKTDKLIALITDEKVA